MNHEERTRITDTKSQVCDSMTKNSEEGGTCRRQREKCVTNLCDTTRSPNQQITICYEPPLHLNTAETADDIFSSSDHKSLHHTGKQSFSDTHMKMSGKTLLVWGYDQIRAREDPITTTRNDVFQIDERTSTTTVMNRSDKRAAVNEWINVRVGLGEIRYNVAKHHISAHTGRHWERRDWITVGGELKISNDRPTTTLRSCPYARPSDVACE